MNRIDTPPRRALAILATLIITMSAMLIAMSMIFRSRADIAHLRVSIDAAQSRALLRSGATLLMNLLNEQRDQLLNSELPELQNQYTIYERGDTLGIIRLLPFDDNDTRIIDEASRLDLNHIDAPESLVATGFVDEQLARAIMTQRDQRFNGAFQSVGDLLQISGVTDEHLYGPAEDVTVDLQPNESLGGRISDRLAETTQPRGFTDVTTVFAIEPALQHSGRLRINLNVPWSDELGRRADERFGAGASATLKQIFDNGTTFTSDGDIVRVLRLFDVPTEDWPDILDALTTDDGDYHFGRVNINTATLEVLAALPGLDETQAAAMVQMRDQLSDQDRRTIVWPVIHDIVPRETFDELAGRITTRSWTFRVRVVAGEVDADAPDAAPAHARVAEIVFDLAGPEPRIALWRDVTNLDLTARLAAARSAEGPPAPVTPSPTDTFPPPPRSSSYDEPSMADAEPDAPADSTPPGVRIGRWRSGS